MHSFTLFFVISYLSIIAERKILNNPEEINTDIFVTAIQEPLTSNECNSVATPKKANGLPGIPEETNDSAEKVKYLTDFDTYLPFKIKKSNYSSFYKPQNNGNRLFVL
jgi:hypothetical protein